MRASGMRVWKLFLCWLCLVAVVRADQATDLANIHVEVIGGRERIAALKALRATGYVFAGGKKVRFSQITARPNRVRQEIGAAGRSLVQASDGATAPWKFDTGVWPPRYAEMPAGEAKLFTADAEFDDPLVAGAERGYVFDYAGEVTVGGRKLLRLLVTKKMAESFSLLLDAENYFIVARLDRRTSPAGRAIEIATRFDDFRPVEGVLLPHKVSVLTEGKIVQQIVIEAIVANPEVTDETFARPKAATAGEKK